MTGIREELTAFIITLMMGIVSSSAISISIYQTTLRNIPEDSHVDICRPENVKHHLSSETCLQI
jgi:hypothetical protein